MSRLLPIGVTAFIIASLAIFFFGDSGLTAFRSRSEYERSLAANVEDLKRRNDELQARLQLLKTDRQSIEIMAREIGMFEPTDVVVKLAGRSPRQPLYAMGDLLRLRKVDSTRNAAFKKTTLVVTAVFLLLALVSARLARKRREKSGPFGSTRKTRPFGAENGVHSSLLMQNVNPSGSPHGAGRR
jgi:cell division protein FtsB